MDRVDRPPSLGIVRLWGAILILLLGGCATPGSGRHAAGPANAGTMRHSAVQALRDPATWVPAAGALIFGLGNLDQEVSDWAVDNTPLFGSRDTAAKASDAFQVASCTGTLVSTLALPHGEAFDPARLRLLGMEGGALLATGLATYATKELSNRERPDSSNRKSFPSGHSSTAFACSTMGARNLAALNLNDGPRSILGAGLTVIASGTAWARIESQSHYPSDVLAGASLGHFMAAFFERAFPHLRPAKGVGFALDRTGGNVRLGMRMRY